MVNVISLNDLKNRENTVDVETPWNMGCVRPDLLGPEIIQEIKEKVSKIDSPCVAEVHDNEKHYIIGENCNRGRSQRRTIFNAIPATSNSDEVYRITTPNRGKSALRTKYQFDKMIKYKRGAMY